MANSNPKCKFPVREAGRVSSKSVSVKLPEDLDNYVRSQPSMAEWLRKAIARQIEEDMKNAI